MRIKQNDDTRLLIVDFPWGFGALSLFGFAVCAGRLLYRLPQGPSHGELLGLSIGTLLFLGGTCVFFRRTVFDFDRSTRLLRWKNYGFPRVTGGSVPFDQIVSVQLDVMSGEHGPAYRVSIKTAERVLPLSIAYTEGKQEESRCTRIQYAIQKVLGQSATQADDEILALAASGKKLEAVQLVRARLQMDLTQATQFVEELTAR